MKKQISIFVLLIILLTALSNLTGCKNKDNDPRPTNTGCVYETYTTDRYVENRTNYDTLYMAVFGANGSKHTGSPTKFITTRDPYLGTFYGKGSILSKPTNCSYFRDSVGLVFYNKDSSFVRVVPSYCPKNGSVSYILE